MPQGVDDIIAKLGLWRIGQEAAVIEGLHDGAALVQASLDATTAYDDDTTATRASSVALVFGPGQDPSSEAAHALAEAEAANPGKTESVPYGPGNVAELPHIVATAYTDYAKELELDEGGQRAFINPSVRSNATRITQAIARRCRERNR